MIKFCFGKSFLKPSALFKSTSATATKSKCLLRAKEPISAPAIPLAPKLACLNRSLGGLDLRPEEINGKEIAESVAERTNFRREILLELFIGIEQYSP